MVQVPADVFLGKHGGDALIDVLGWQLAWVVALFVAGRVMTRVAARHLAVSGG